MRKIGALVIAALASACSPGGDVPIATAAAESFHKQLNAGSYDAIYAQADRLMKNATPAKSLTLFLGEVHSKLGDFISAETAGWNDQVTANGHFVTLIYRSKYARRGAEENFVFRIDSDRATLVSYRLTTPEAPPT